MGYQKCYACKEIWQIFCDYTLFSDAEEEWRCTLGPYQRFQGNGSSQISLPS